jgi:hypothetical protein
LMISTPNIVTIGRSGFDPVDENGAFLGAETDCGNPSCHTNVVFDEICDNCVAAKKNYLEYLDVIVFDAVCGCVGIWTGEVEKKQKKAPPEAERTRGEARCGPWTAGAAR